MKNLLVGRLVALALSASQMASCSAGFEPKPLRPDSASSLPSYVRRSSSATASVQENTPSAIPPALRARIQLGVYPAWMRTAGDAIFDDGYTYVGQEFGKTINQYPTNNPNNLAPRCTIPNADYGPLGMTTDKLGTLYFTADFIRARGIATYRPNCGGPGPRYIETAGNPQDPVVDGGILYLTTLFGYNQGYPAEIVVFSTVSGAAADPTPLRELSYPIATTGLGVAVDSHHNLFWSAASQNYNDGFVVEFANGQMPGRLLSATKLGTDYPGGVVIDHANNLLLIDQNKTSIFVFAPPYTSRPFETIVLKGNSLYCALGLRQVRLYCTDVQYGSVDVYTYPGGNYRLQLQQWHAGRLRHRHRHSAADSVIDDVLTGLK